MGPLVSGIVWLAAQALFTWVSPAASMWALFVGGAPLELLLKAFGGPASLPKGHPSAALATQSAMVAPAGSIVAIVLGVYDADLFSPSTALLVGVDYLTFVSLYGMKVFYALAGALMLVGVLGLLAFPSLGGYAGWAAAAVLLTFVIPLFRASR